MNGGIDKDNRGSALAKSITLGISKGSVKAIRCSIPRANDYYSARSKEPAFLHAQKSKACATCAVCGRLATNKCSKCKSVSYCCR